MAYLTNHNKFDCVAKKDLDEKATIAQLQVFRLYFCQSRASWYGGPFCSFVQSLAVVGLLHAMFLLMGAYICMVTVAGVVRR